MSCVDSGIRNEVILRRVAERAVSGWELTMLLGNFIYERPNARKRRNASSTPPFTDM